MFFVYSGWVSPITGGVGVARLVRAGHRIFRCYYSCLITIVQCGWCAVRGYVAGLPGTLCLCVPWPRLSLPVNDPAAAAGGVSCELGPSSLSVDSGRLGPGQSGQTTGIQSPGPATTETGAWGPADLIYKLGSWGLSSNKLRRLCRPMHWPHIAPCVRVSPLCHNFSRQSGARQSPDYSYPALGSSGPRTHGPGTATNDEDGTRV